MQLTFGTRHYLEINCRSQGAGRRRQRTDRPTWSKYSWKSGSYLPIGVKWLALFKTFGLRRQFSDGDVMPRISATKSEGRSNLAYQRGSPHGSHLHTWTSFAMDLVLLHWWLHLLPSFCLWGSLRGWADKCHYKAQSRTLPPASRYPTKYIYIFMSW